MNCASVTRPLSPEAAAYIAGLIDGEGTITLSRLHANENRRLVISIANTEIQLLEFVRNETGVGKITRKRRTSEFHTQSYCYSVTSQTPRNGRYSREQLAERQEFENAFLSLVATTNSNGVRESPAPNYALNHHARNSSMLM